MSYFRTRPPAAQNKRRQRQGGVPERHGKIRQMQSASLLCHRPGEKSGGSDTRVTGQWADRFTATRAGQRWHSHRTRPLGLTKNGADLHPKPSVRRTGWGRGSPQKRKGRSGFSKEVRSRAEAGARGVPDRRKVVQWERFANPPPSPIPVRDPPVDRCGHIRVSPILTVPSQGRALKTRGRARCS